MQIRLFLVTSPPTFDPPLITNKFFDGEFISLNKRAAILIYFTGLLNEACLESIHSSTEAGVENLRSAVFQCVDILAADALDKYPNTPMIVLNSVLVEMGLIKSEDKKHQAVDDIRGLAVVLGHMCQQPYFPKFIKSVIRSIVVKDDKKWNENAATLRSQLLHILYT